MKNITGIILTKNSELTIEESLLSIINIVDEMIVVDDLSSDKTIEIIKNIDRNIKIISHKLNRFDNQRNLAISAAQNKWILMIDSDEIISKELSESIKDTKEEKEIDAYWVIRENIIIDKNANEKYTNRPILFKNTLKFSYPVHETILIDKKRIKKLNGHLKHKNWKSFKHNLDKINLYSELMAIRWIEEKRDYGKINTLLLALIWPVYAFLQAYFGRKYYKMYLFGLVYSIYESFWRLVGILKFYEKKYKKY